MRTKIFSSTLASAFAVVVVAFGPALPAFPQDIHNHTPAISGVPQGVPYFCANPSVTSVASGAWSDSKIWSSGKPPGRNDKVKIASGHNVIFDALSDAPLECVEVDGVLRFATDKDTRLKVGNLMVMDTGSLEVGTVSKPVGASVIAEIIIADQSIDREVDPGQIGTGIEGLGKITMHGSLKAPTFVRLAREPAAGDATLVLEEPVSGWMQDDRLVIPDTRQLRSNERGA